MKRSCDHSEPSGTLPLQIQSWVLSLLRGALVLLCLAALAGLLLFPHAAVPLGVGMLLILGLWIGSYALEAALLSLCGRSCAKL